MRPPAGDTRLTGWRGLGASRGPTTRKQPNLLCDILTAGRRGRVYFLD